MSVWLGDNTDDSFNIIKSRELLTDTDCSDGYVEIAMRIS